MAKRIDKFDNEYAFLSNFYPASVHYNGLVFANNEAAFQAQKCPCRSAEFTFFDNPGKAKRLGRKVELRRDWEEIKERVMYEVCLCKFTQHEDLKKKLLETGDAELVEGNYWHDCYWGVCEEQGENKLGKILMRIREELRYKQNETLG